MESMIFYSLIDARIIFMNNLYFKIDDGWLVHFLHFTNHKFDELNWNFFKYHNKNRHNLNFDATNPMARRIFYLLFFALLEFG
jgi:hypothetical protein